jgi:hypothetical protein
MMAAKFGRKQFDLLVEQLIPPKGRNAGRKVFVGGRMDGIGMRLCWKQL